MSDRDPLEGIPEALLDWHKGALEGDLAVCAAPQPGVDGFPCIHNRAYHDQHRDVLGRTWPFDAEEPLRVAHRVPVIDGTVTLSTSDHGPVTTQEPGWCLGHSARAPGYRIDLTHTGPEHTFAFAGDTLLVAMLSQDPFVTDPERRRTRLYIEQTGYSATLDPAGVRQLAAALTVHAMHLRTLADQLATLRAEEGEQ
ncbi:MULTISPECIES: DUF6907 domain-containing protein [Streptomyces]|uniref:DUF6907 domain-containing protein n=1 Tax=Streptomyces TaxID=1883 RepID=UPI00068E713F|nr:MULTISPECIES: hypothetical protein [Streptomyces]WSQ21789.1 hypothetical protein OG237_32340 [Streptomyces zaomyceticus]